MSSRVGNLLRLSQEKQNRLSIIDTCEKPSITVADWIHSNIRELFNKLGLELGARARER